MKWCGTTSIISTFMKREPHVFQKESSKSSIGDQYTKIGKGFIMQSGTRFCLHIYPLPSFASNIHMH